jgi:hypothetical protein
MSLSQKVNCLDNVRTPHSLNVPRKPLVSYQTIADLFNGLLDFDAFLSKEIFAEDELITQIFSDLIVEDPFRIDKLMHAPQRDTVSFGVVDEFSHNQSHHFPQFCDFAFKKVQHKQPALLLAVDEPTKLGLQVVKNADEGFPDSRSPLPEVHKTLDRGSLQFYLFLLMDGVNAQVVLQEVTSPFIGQEPFETPGLVLEFALADFEESTVLAERVEAEDVRVIRQLAGFHGTFLQ